METEDEITLPIHVSVLGRGSTAADLPLCIPVSAMMPSLISNDAALAASVLASYSSSLTDESPPRKLTSLRKADRDAVAQLSVPVPVVADEGGSGATGVTTSASGHHIPPLIREAQEVGDSMVASGVTAELPAGQMEDIQMYDRNHDRVSLAIEKHLYKLASSKLVVRMDQDTNLREDEQESQRLHDHILTPHYRNYLETVRDYSAHDVDAFEASSAHLPITEEIPREYFHDYYRPARVDLGERPCINGSHCIAITTARQWKDKHPNETQLIPPETPLREWFLHREMAAMGAQVSSGRTPGEVYAEQRPRLCIFCVRNMTNTAGAEIASDVDRMTFSNKTAQAANMVPMRIVQNHSYIMDREGEYNSQVCQMLCGQNFQGIIKPFVQFNVRFYTPVLHQVHIASTGYNVSVVGWADDPSVIYHYAGDGYEGYD